MRKFCRMACGTVAWFIFIIEKLAKLHNPKRADVLLPRDLVHRLNS